MTELFDITKQNISLHTRNAFKESEFDENAVVKESLTTAPDGKSHRVHISYYWTVKLINACFKYSHFYS